MVIVMINIHVEVGVLMIEETQIILKQWGCKNNDRLGNNTVERVADPS